jgi:hypothetical protein
MVALVGKSLTPGDLRSEKEIEYLAMATRDPDSNVAVNAMEGLGVVTGIGREFDHDWWRRWWEHHLLEKKDEPVETSPAPTGPAPPPKTSR